MVSVLLVNHDPIVRIGFAELLRSEFGPVEIADALPQDESLMLLRRKRWHLIIVGIGETSNISFQYLSHVVKVRAEIPVLMVGERDNQLHVMNAKKLGAAGYTSRDRSRAELVQAVRDLLDRKEHFPGVTAQSKGGRIVPSLGLLSPREYRVLLDLTEGKRISEIAADMDLSVKTISTYKRRILNKLGMKSTTDLIQHVIVQKSAGNS